MYVTSPISSPLYILVCPVCWLFLQVFFSARQPQSQLCPRLKLDRTTPTRRAWYTVSTSSMAEVTSSTPTVRQISPRCSNSTTAMTIAPPFSWSNNPQKTSGNALLLRPVLLSAKLLRSLGLISLNFSPLQHLPALDMPS